MTELTEAINRNTMWLQIAAIILAVIVLLLIFWLVSELSTGQNERRDEKARLEREAKPRG